MSKIDEYPRHHPAYHTDQYGFDEQQFGKLRQHRDMEVFIGNAPGLADLEGRYPCNDSRKQEVVPNTPYGQHFDAIDRSANGCAEYRSEEHTSELQSLMRISYAVFCLKKKKKIYKKNTKTLNH